jgi:integrase
VRKLLTDTLIRSHVPPSGGRVELADARSVGLELRITATGTRTWSFRYRHPLSRKPLRYLIGPYPEISLAAAREQAEDLRRDVAKNIDPIERRNRKRTEAPKKTFEYLADRYMAEHARRFKRSAGEDERRLKLHVLPRWGKRNYEQISRGDVIQLIEEIIAAGTPSLANSVHALISTIFSFAVNNGLLQGSPCVRLRKRAAENIGRRVLNDAEIVMFWSQILHSPVSRPVGLALRLALLTGARAGEVAGMRRTELSKMDNAAEAEWIIPSDRSKNGRPHAIPLAPLAISQIQVALELLRPDAEYVFPSPSSAGGITGHALAVAMRRFADNLPDVAPARSWRAEHPTPHDLRRTFATRLSALGVPKEDRDACMNHARSDVGSRHYDLYERAREKRAALNLWAGTLSSFIPN